MGNSTSDRKHGTLGMQSNQGILSTDEDDHGAGDTSDGSTSKDSRSSASSSRLANPTTQGKLLHTLEQLLATEATNVKSALDQASDLIAGAINAEKIDIFLYDPSVETLVAMGISNTPMGKRQVQIGMNRLPVANKGQEVAVFTGGTHYYTGHAEQDPLMLPGFTKGLGVRSSIVVPIDVDGERRGVLQAISSKPDAFSQDDLVFVEAVSHWVSTLIHRAELAEHVAQDAAVQARQVVAEELITVLAHDLRHYLTPLKGWLGIVHERAKRDNRAVDITALSTAFLAVNRLETLIRDLLDVGRLDQGLFSVSVQPADLVVLVRDTAGALGTTGSTGSAQPGHDGRDPRQDVKQVGRQDGRQDGWSGEAAQAGTVNILLRVSDELIAQVDPSRLRQALENVIANALAHSPKGVPVLVEVTSEKRLRAEGPGEEEWAIITIQDQGPGIPAELLPRLFARFAAGPNSTGLGLGLYMARSIAEAHGGTLTVESQPGQGTTFLLSLPTGQ